MLCQQTWNIRNLYIIERLPKFDVEIKKVCDERGIITTTRNCEVPNFAKDPKGDFYSQPINSVESIESLSEVAAKNQSSNKANSSTPPIKQFKSLFQCQNNFEKSKTAHITGTKHQLATPKEDDKLRKRGAIQKYTTEW